MTDMQNSTDGGNREEAEKILEEILQYAELVQGLRNGEPYADVRTDRALKLGIPKLASALSDARKRERERVREAVEGALNGIGGVKPMEVNGKTEYGFSFGWDAGAKAARSAALKAFDEPV